MTVEARDLYDILRRVAQTWLLDGAVADEAVTDLLQTLNAAGFCVIRTDDETMSRAVEVMRNHQHIQREDTTNEDLLNAALAVLRGDSQ